MVKWMEDEKRGMESQKSHRWIFEKPKYLLLWAAVLLSLLGAGAFFFYLFAYRVEPAFSTATYELGEGISSNLEDYLVGTEWSVGLAELDLSQVDRGRAGTYQAAVTHGRTEFLYEIVIQDTVAPEILLREEPIYLAAGREYGPDALVAGVVDQDAQVIVGFHGLGMLDKTVCFEESGDYTCIVTAVDSSGNRSLVSIPVTVDTAPEISGVQDFYIALGSQVDYLEQVTATDERDGDLTRRITVDDKTVELEKEGSYTLTYRVVDDLGLDTESRVQVTVLTAQELQGLIGARQVDRHEDRVIGAINLYDGGVNDHEDIEDTLEYMRPAFVQLYVKKGGGYSAGSGYIVEITEDTVYICSNRHVVGAHDRWDVYFFDGTRVTGLPLGTSEEYDVGVVTVKKADLPEKLIDQLMTVHIDRGYWNDLDDQRIDVGLERVDRKGGILRVATGTLVKVKQHFMWYDQKDHTEVTLVLEHGDSGSAILDGYGNLIGMAYAYSSSPRRNWCVPLDGILACYEEITGRSVYVY